ncbi:hypothetical protein BDQ12DRAFT_671460 [Crucibulum laeve]|uniref:Rhodopsin domain-containing protein n=1 Tax=Crucibulum laeve TaxID=68775 RepID=A0A5C3LH57_9AGAR|nr:hypothetical protein BDQ12DRAFT_671460 [Crucibulum laeve]
MEIVAYRRWTRRLWWDDYASIVPAIFECFKIVVTWLRLRRFDQSEHSRHLKITLSFMNQTCFGFIVWWSRISLALAVVRITPVGSKARPWAIGLTCYFILNFIAIVFGVTGICAMHTAWQHAKADIIGDVLLVGFPMYRLWCSKLQPAQRRLVFLVFSTSVLTLVAVGVVAIVSNGRVVKGPRALLVLLTTMNIEVITSHLIGVVSPQNQTSDNVVQISTSEAFLYHSDRNARPGNDNEVSKVTEDDSEAIPRQGIIV